MNQNDASTLAGRMASLFQKMNGAQREEWETILLEFAFGPAMKGIANYYKNVSHDGFLDKDRMMGCIRACVPKDRDGEISARHAQVLAEAKERWRKNEEERREADFSHERAAQRLSALPDTERAALAERALERVPECLREKVRGMGPERSPTLRSIMGAILRSEHGQ